MSFELLEQEIVFEGKAFKVSQDRVRFPDQREVKFDMVQHAGAVVILPVDNEGMIWFVRQFDGGCRCPGTQNERSWNRQFSSYDPLIFRLCLRTFGPAGWHRRFGFLIIFKFFPLHVTHCDDHALDRHLCAHLAAAVIRGFALY